MRAAPRQAVGLGIVLLIVGNACAILSDAVIKQTTGQAPVFQFVLLRNIASVLLLLPFWLRSSASRRFRGIGIHLVRSHISLIAVVCLVFALANLPLATVTALFYTSPLFVIVLAVVALGERLSVGAVVGVLSGAIGSAVILRPATLEWAAFSALAVAFCLALIRVLVRKLPSEQGTIEVLTLNYLLILPASAMLAWAEGAAWSLSVVVSAVLSSLLILAYNGAVFLAYRHALAQRVTSAEYTGLIWSVLIGWIAFGETPTGATLAGALLIVSPVLLMATAGNTREGESRSA